MQAIKLQLLIVSTSAFIVIKRKKLYLSKVLEDILGQLFMCIEFQRVQREDKNILIFFKRGIVIKSNS